MTAPTLGFSHHLVRQRLLDTVITVTPERRHDLIESRHDTKPTAQSHWLPLQDHFLVRRNRFKEINDTRGHAVGDRVLAVTAQRLTAWAGGGVVGRIGGDEFALTVRIAPAYHALRLSHLAALLAEPVPVDGEAPVPVAASIGAATPNRLTITDLPLLLRAAAAILYPVTVVALLGTWTRSDPGSASRWGTWSPLTPTRTSKCLRNSPSGTQLARSQALTT
ncbi:diguanylate cyclase [Streptomyces sp. NBC_01431]|uniref:diguanylate cyclase n=1 Tax=Streptomyces sp. NBC_01431 TaxID=2903863 RepID=UPI002E37B3C7|nr:diguanylate cyclase [Streptomyces sp. NBC_01431]